MKRKVHVYANHLSSEIISLFEGLIDEHHVAVIDKQLLVFIDDLYYENDMLDYEGLYELIRDDFSVDLTMLIEPYTEEELPISIECSKHLKNMKSGIYGYEEVLLEALLNKDKVIVSKLKEFINSQLHQEVIHSVRAFIDHNMNSSVTAKSLFMHRNTLNYRIDQFVSATHIEVKTFIGAMVIYLLYRE
ncbi:MAG: helix-turn-helix domain-containing protein [Candidatus Izemoplasmataceae bacterium]